MKSDWAADQLQTIRTLMERSALYRRALAPVTTLAGVAGLAAGALGWFLGLTGPVPFVLFWIATAVVVVILASLLIRRQAFKAAEPFWSPPTRRVAQAGALPGIAAAMLSAMFCLADPLPENIFTIIILWLLFYGFGLNAAGFFMQRGIRLFGWIMALSGLGLGGYFFFTGPPDLGTRVHLLMGALFGLPHLAYGVYLYFTEKKAGVA